MSALRIGVVGYGYIGRSIVARIARSGEWMNSIAPISTPRVG